MTEEDVEVVHAERTVPGEQLVEGVAQRAAVLLLNETAGVLLVTVFGVHVAHVVRAVVVSTKVDGQLQALQHAEARRVATELYARTHAGSVALGVGIVEHEHAQRVEVAHRARTVFAVFTLFTPVVEYAVLVVVHRVALCILQIDGEQRVDELCGVPHVRGRCAVVVAEVRLRVGQSRAQVGLEPVGHLALHVGTCRIALERCCLQQTVFVQIAEREHILRAVATAVDRELMLVAESILTQHGVHPVFVPSRLGISTHLSGSGVDDVVPCVVLERVVELAAHLAAERSAGSSLSVGKGIALVELEVVAQCLVVELHKLLLADVVVFLDGAVAPTDGRTPVDVGLTRLTLLRGDHHHTVGTTCTIQCTGRGVLQDGHRLDVGGVDRGEVAVVRCAVDDIERCARSVDGAETTHADGW